MSGELAMDDTADVRWKQRFENYKKALAVLRRGLESVSPEKEVDEFQKLGIIQAFEFTQELSWKVLEDFITNSGGGEKIYGSKDAVRQAFSRSLISDGETWMDMIDSRNESSHLYDETTSDKIFSKISSLYLPCFSALEKTLSDLAGQEKDE